MLSHNCSEWQLTFSPCISGLQSHCGLILMSRVYLGKVVNQSIIFPLAQTSLLATQSTSDWVGSSIYWLLATNIYGLGIREFKAL